MKIKVSLPLKKIICIIAILFVKTNILLSQNSLFLKYPGLKITPEDFIPSSAHAAGYMQYSYEDPIRDLFITPGKNLPEFKATGFLSYQFYADDKEYNVTSYEPYFENYKSIFHKNHFPIGGVLNLYGITFGFLYGYGSIPMEHESKYNKGYGVSGDTLKSKGINKYYNLSFSANPISSLTLGISYASHDFNRDYTYGGQDYNIKYFIPDELVVGVGYTFKDKFKIYLAYGNYKIKNEERRKNSLTPDLITTIITDYNGNLFNLDLKYSYQDNLSFYLRTSYDTRNIDWKEEKIEPQKTYSRFQDGNAKYYKIGFGTNYKLDKINFLSEFNYEPGYYNLQYATTTVTWDPPVSGNEIYHYDWNFGLGVEVQLFDFMKLQLGNRYYKSQRKLTQEVDLTKYSTFDPYFPTSTNVITAGTEIRLFNFVFNYIFNHSSYQNYFIPNLSPFPPIQFREFNPVQHKFLVRYEF